MPLEVIQIYFLICLPLTNSLWLKEIIILVIKVNLPSRIWDDFEPKIRNNYKFKMLKIEKLQERVELWFH